MNAKTKIYIACAAAAIFAIGIFGGSAIEGRRTRQLERRIDEATHSADASARTAEQREREAAGYRDKIAYLENQIADSRQQAAKQDEKLKNQTSVTDNARRDVARARGVRSGDASVTELCRKLEALGHKCAD